MFLAKISINRPILTSVFLIVLLAFGFISYYKLNLNQMPDVAIPFISISIVYPGAGPKEIETQVTKKIEDAISTVSEIERIESYSLESIAIIIMEFKLSKDINVANQEVKDKIDAILNNLPKDAHKPLIQKIDFAAFPIMNLVLSGDIDSRVLHDIAHKQLKDRLSQIKGVGQVRITGGQEREIQINLDSKTIFENSISLQQLVQILGVQNMDLPGGFFNLNNQEFSVRLQGKFPDLEAIKQLQILTNYGYKELSQIANVLDTGKTIRERSIFFDNKTGIRDPNAIRIGIIKSPEGNIVKIAKEISESLPDIKKLLPQGVKLEIINDESVYVKSSVEDTLSNIVIGVILTSIILLIFLGDLRSTFIVALSMPTSIITTFLFFSIFDMTLNMMSLMGLSVSVGVLVANSIVVLENIFRHKNMGKTNKRAAFDGTTEVTVAVLASTLTNIVVFLPIANMTSMVGLFLVELALAASFSTIMSIIMSFTLTPMLSSLILPKDTTRGKIGKLVDDFEKMVSSFYKILLEYTLKNKIVSTLIIIGSFLFLFIVLIIYGPHIGGEFMPVFDNGKLQITVELPGGYNLDETYKIVKTIENRVKKHKQVDYILTDIGKINDIDKGTNKASLLVQLCDVKFRDFKHEEFVPILTRDLADIPNAKIIVQTQESMGVGSAPIEFFLLGQDQEVLDNLKSIVMDTLKNIPGLINLDNSFREGKPEITIKPKREMLAKTGLTAMDLAMTVRTAIEGLTATQYKELNEEYDITVTLNDESINSVGEISNLTIVSQKGSFKLSQLADLQYTKSYSNILHRDKYTAIKFTGSNALGVPLANVTGEITKRLNNIKFPTGYSYKWAGSTKMMNDMFADMIFTFVLAVFLTYMLLAAILESFLQPIFILITVVLALIGVIISLYYFDINLNIVSLMAIVMLIGIVVNNAILMLDYTNQLVRDEGKSLKDALIIACPTKLKPIIMSTTAIILGMFPMALGIGEAGVEMRQALGIVSIGGLLVSTALTLFVIPAFYYILSRQSSSKRERESNV